MANFQNAREVETDTHDSGDMTRMLQSLALQGSVHFAIKKLRKSQVPEQTLSRSCRLMIPAWFVQKHGDKFRQTVVLRSGMSTVPCRVRLTVVHTSSGIPEIKLGRGWRDFATYNRLAVGDSVIFELRRLSEFAVHIFRALSSSKKCAADKSEPRDDDDDSSAGSQRRSGDAADWTAKKGGIVESRLQDSYQGPELENIVTPILETLRHDLQSSQELRAPVELAPTSSPDEFTARARHNEIHDDQQQTARESLPSFTQRLVLYNVQDAVGNTCGAVFEVPWSFVMAHGVHLLEGAHVHLQGIGEESPARAVTANCVHRTVHNKSLVVMWWGWGDFVRENGLRAGQVLQFTLRAESSIFQVREIQL